MESVEFSNLTWLTGFTTTLILPLIIVLAAHGILNIPLRDSQGTVIFLFFGWATSSQAILTLYRLRAVASWKVAVTMLSALFVVVVTYLFAAESFTQFLFPAPGEVAHHFRAGALPVALFDLLVTAFALVIVLGWILIYAASHGRTMPVPQWAKTLQFTHTAINKPPLSRHNLAENPRPDHTRHRPAESYKDLFHTSPALFAVAPGIYFIAQIGEFSASATHSSSGLRLRSCCRCFHYMDSISPRLTRSPGYGSALAPFVAAAARGLCAWPIWSSDFPSEFLSAVQALALVGDALRLAQSACPSACARTFRLSQPGTLRGFLVALRDFRRFSHGRLRLHRRRRAAHIAGYALALAVCSADVTAILR